MGEANTVLVTATGGEPPRLPRAIDAASPKALVEQVDAIEDLDTVVALVDGAVAVGGAVDRDELIALVAVLVVRGVTMFETAYPQVVRRSLDTYAAITAGDIEVLTP